MAERICWDKGMHTSRIPVLDTLRGLAALLVVLVHLMGIAQLDPGMLFRWVEAHGGFAVPLFFALSAFSLATGYAFHLNNRENLRTFYLQLRFALRRFSTLAFFSIGYFTTRTA